MTPMAFIRETALIAGLIILAVVAIIWPLAGH